jgi:hypothetical protein
MDKFREIVTESELGGRLHVVVDELTELHHGQREIHIPVGTSKDGHTDVSSTHQSGAIYGQSDVLNTLNYSFNLNFVNSINKRFSSPSL